MAKEIMIVFVYDTIRSNIEELDPVESVVYFYPAWVSPAQKLALAGQLMGIVQFMIATYSAPYLISLQGGKFALKTFGHYVLAVGTDRNIQDWILQRRANTLESLLKFFHCDLDTISSSLNNDRNKFTEKLYQMFETYLPILQYSASLFSDIPTLKLPRTASNVFLESIHFLHNCQEISGILGGSLLYNNKVVATQLGAEINKHLVLTDPYRIKSPAERISTTFELPFGVQLLRIYLDQKQGNKIDGDPNVKCSHSSKLTVSNRKVLQKNNFKDQPITLIKHDTSRIFTVPEEVELELPVNHASIPNFSALTNEISYTPAKREEGSTADQMKHQMPVTLSICSTPLKDINRVLHGTSVSICSAADEIENQSMIRGQSNNLDENVDDISKIVGEALRYKQFYKLKNATCNHNPMVENNLDKKSLSLSGIEDLRRKFLNRKSLRMYNLRPSKIDKNVHTGYDFDISQQKVLLKKKYFNTISDPHFPIFRGDGLPVSQSLYNEYISAHNNKLYPSSFSLNSPYEPLSTLSLSVRDNVDFINTKREVDCTLDARSENRNKQEFFRRSMSLPLKPLNIRDDDRKIDLISEFEIQPKRKPNGLQLTPLMSKLSFMSDEKTSGFSSREIPPSDIRDISNFYVTMNNLVEDGLQTVDKNVRSDAHEDISIHGMTITENKNCVERAELFLCGHKNMVLILIMQNGMCSNAELIHLLWRTCVRNLGKLEFRLQQCLEPLPVAETKELYSVLTVDCEWDTVYRSGLWGVAELDIISVMHSRFSHANNLTDIIIRAEDSVLYGNQCGAVKVYYQQAIELNTPGGLPTPADLMGIVPLKAKRRAERDHGIVLL